MLVIRSRLANGSSLIETLVAIAIFSTVTLASAFHSLSSLKITHSAFIQTQDLINDVSEGEISLPKRS